MVSMVMSTSVEQRARPVVIVSNRGPLAYRVADDGALVARRGGGGLVSGIAPLVSGTGATWIASALSPADRRAGERGEDQAEGFRVRLLGHDPTTLRLAYDVVGNTILWFVHHGLFDLAHRPQYDRRFREAWEAYRAYNATFAEAVIAHTPADAVVLVQDYHLSLFAAQVRARRDDLALVHFSHTPFAGPELLGQFPDPFRRELLEGLAANDACGFHTDRWRRRFLASCEEFGVRPPATFVAPLAADADDLARVATSEACRRWEREIDQIVGDRQLVVRVDRMELSKNLLRGFLAYEDLLEHNPSLRGRVVFLASVYPSREGLPEYLAYRRQTEALVERINARWGEPGWQPIVLFGDDDFARSVALLRRSDVLLVNPVSDGLNLVAKEGALLNTRDGQLVLSTGAGVYDELGDAAFAVHPCDVTATSDALREALALQGPARVARAAMLRARAGARTPADWLADQLAAVSSR